MRLALICVLLLNLTPDATNAQEAARSGQGAMIRTLDKVSGRTADLEFGLLQRHSIGKLQIELTEDVVYMQRMVVSVCTLTLVCLLYAAWSLLPSAKISDLELLVLLFVSETLGWSLQPIYRTVFWLMKSE